MNLFIPRPLKLHVLPAVLLLTAVIQACQVSTGINNPTPTSPPSPGYPQPQMTSTAAKTPAASGAWSLSQPAAGLEAFASYHQHFASSIQGTYQGKPYQASSDVDRRLNGLDELSLVISTNPVEKPFYLQLTRSGGQTYVQQKAGQSCRAQDVATDRPDQDLNPAFKLPPVLSASQVGSEVIDGLPTVHYHFDANGVRDQAGKDGTGDGEVWVAQDGGAVLKYQLAVEITDGDFKGVRSWNYILNGVNKGTPVALPDGCLPLLSDLPALPGMAEVTSVPGFMRYSANSTIPAAVKFFQDQLPSKNWYALPGDEPQAASALLKFGRSMADGSGQVLVVQLAAQDQTVQVVIQIVKTNQPLKAAAPLAAGVTPAPGEAVETPDTAPNAALPADLPLYPGAKVILQTDQALMCQSSAAVELVVKFYLDQMSAAGWSQTDNTAMGAITTQTWQKSNTSLRIILSFQNNQTQIVITSGQ